VTGILQFAKRLHRSRRLRVDGLVFLVRPLEIRDLVVGFEMPDTGGDLFDQVMIVRDQKNRSLVSLERDV
jgi:hypothetical protein